MGEVQRMRERSEHDNLRQTKHSTSIVQRFLVRRTRFLEIMYTNGMTSWEEPIKNSQVSYPQVISDITLSKDNQKLIVYYQTPNKDGQVSIKTFILTNKGFKIYKDDKIGNLKQMKNLIFNNNPQSASHNELLEIKIEMTSSREGELNPEGNIKTTKSSVSLNISLPKTIFIEQLLDPNN